MKIKVSTPSIEGMYQGAKWLKIQALLEKKELESLFQALSCPSIFPLSQITDGNPVSRELFFREYGEWIEKLKEGHLPLDSEMKKFLAAALVEDSEDLWLQEIPQKGYLTKLRRPLIQMQAHYFTYSNVDGVFRPMSMGSQSIFWGLQFSFPQVYQDGKTMEMKEAPSSLLFQTLRRWMRDFTLPTPFVVEGKRINSSMRLGRECFPWIDQHPQLLEQKIGIFHAN